MEPRIDPHPVPPGFRFGPFELDARTGELLKAGIKLRLQEKPLQVLLALLECPGEMVSREQLIARLWPDGTFVEFDLALNAAVRRLRDVLNDSAEAPRYIETLPRHGYRFIDTVEQVEDAELPLDEISTAEPTSASPVVAGGWSRNLRLAMTAALLLVALLALLGVRQWSQSRTIEFSKRDWVLVSQFENRTGDHSLDGSLEALLEREISNSHYVNVVPPERLNDTMRLMRAPMEGLPPLAVAREVAQRDGGIKAVIAGKVERISGRYVIGASVIRPTDGVTVSSYTEEAGTEQEIVPAVRRLSFELRERLGEDVAEIQRSVESLEKATTPSLAALRLFSRSMPYMIQNDWVPASRLLEEALRADPQFATAHVFLAHCYENLNQKKAAAPHWEEAMRLSGQTSEWERLFIIGSYFDRYRVDKKQAITAYETLVNLYPDYYWGINNLAALYGDEPQSVDHEKQAEIFRQHAELRPTDFLANYRAWDTTVGWDQSLQRAAVYRDRALRVMTPGDRASEAGKILIELEPVLQEIQADKLEDAVKDLVVAEQRRPLTPDTVASDYLELLVDLEVGLGRLKTAEEWARRFESADQRNVDLLMLAWQRGDRRREGELARSGTDVGWTTEYFLAHAGHIREAERLALAKSDRIPGRAQGLVHGEISLMRGDLRAAVQQCKETLTRMKSRVTSSTLFAADCASSALEKLGELPEAARILELVAVPERIYYERGVWIMLEVKRARLYRRLGRDADADRVAKRLEQVLAVADPDHPARALLNLLPKTQIAQVTSH